MDLLSKDSLILNLGDLKLSDTEYTFGYTYDSEKYCGDICYEPGQNSVKFLTGDHRVCIKIQKDKENLFHIYCANRSTSNAQNISIGYYDGSYYNFISETFGNIYEEQPELVSRSIIKVPSIYEYCEVQEKGLIYLGKIEKELTKEDYMMFKTWFKYIENFKQAYSKENLDQIRRYVKVK